MLWDIQHFYEDFNLLVLTFHASSSSSPVHDLQVSPIIFSPWSSINVSISFSIEKHHPPDCLVTRTTCFTSFSMTRTPLKGGTCFLRSHPHPLTLWVLIALILRDTWELRSWLMRQCIQGSVLASLPGGRAGRSDALLHLFSLYIHSLPLSDSGHLSSRDLEESMGGGPNSSHSWDTQCIIFENQGVSLCAAPLFVSSSLLSLCWCSIVHTLS